MSPQNEYGLLGPPSCQLRHLPPGLCPAQVLRLSFSEGNRDVVQGNQSPNVRAGSCKRKFTSGTFTELGRGQDPNSLGEQRGRGFVVQ